jgi:hypothetical protein
MAKVTFINPASGKPLAPMDEDSYPAKALATAGWAVQEEPEPVAEPEPEAEPKPAPEPRPKQHKSKG